MQDLTDDYVSFGTESEPAQQWPTSARALSALSGAALLIYGFKKKGGLGTLSAACGLGLIARGMVSAESLRLVAISLHPVIILRRTVEVNAPLDTVFDFWKNFGNYSRFMSFVRDVRVNERGGFHWMMEGPAGMHVEWDAIVTRLIPNQELQWASVPGSRITNSGHVHFNAVSNQKTLVDATLTYAPPAGAIGYTLVKILGFNPQAKIDGDLQRMKNLIESPRESGRIA